MQPRSLSNCRLRRRQVRGYGIVPEPQAREDMSWHVQGMRRIGRNRRISTRCLEAQLGKLRIIDAVNDIVRDARMVLVAWQQPVENVGASLLPGIRLVRGVEIAD